MPHICIINNNKAAPTPQPTKIQKSFLLKNGVFLLMVTVVVVGVLVDVVSEFCMRLDVVSEFCTHFESTVTQPTDTRKAV